VSIEVRSVSSVRELAEACADDWPRLMFDGFGIMVSQEQEEAYLRLGKPGPRGPGEFRFNWLSGGQRAGKTVFAFGTHADAILYKRGLDNTDRRYWTNYRYPTLALAPSDALTLRLWQIGDEISKGSHESQWDNKVRAHRGGAFVGKLKAGTDAKGNGLWRWSNGGATEFRSSEAKATRLEGGQWWWITWDEWASQPDREIHSIMADILPGRSRDHDAKIMPMAWPKEETEHHLIAVVREIEAGRDRDSQVIYLDASKAFFTNFTALATELRVKTQAEIDRTIKGLPAGGASKEFKRRVIDNMVHHELPKMDLPDFESYAYFNSWDLGLSVDSTVGFVWRIPIVGGRRVVSPEWKARIVKRTELPGSDTRDPEDLADAVTVDQLLYRAQSALDATGMGGLMASRRLKNLNPRPHEFKSRSNDRIHGNMRLAAITNGLECASWGRPEQPKGMTDAEYSLVLANVPWGLIEMPNYIETIDQLGTFDRDAKPGIPDDEVWAFLIGLWYIRRWWAVGEPGSIHDSVPYDIRKTAQTEVLRARRGSISMRRSRLIESPTSAVAPGGVRLIKPPERG
jgi:hypothetical protein